MRKYNFKHCNSSVSSIKEFKKIIMSKNQSETKDNHFRCTLDLNLGHGWSQQQFNLSDLTKYFYFEVQILDGKTVRQWIKFSTIQRETKVDHFRCTLALNLGDGWSHKTFNLSEITKTSSFRSDYMEKLRIQITANCRIWRVYFTDRLYLEDEIPKEFKLPLPIQRAKESHWN
uniref:CFA20 domain-containing protein n=1 Tax=Oryzias latipes TaxID=8090 RepID=A0A3P9ILL1_ORYLA